MKSFFAIVSKRTLNREQIDPVRKEFGDESSLVFHKQAKVKYCVISSAESDDSSNKVLCFDGYISNRNYLATKYSLVVKDDFLLFVSLYNKLGLNLLNEIDGAFCFAVINKDNGEIILARDRAGIKPLYWGFISEDLIFSTRLKHIIAYPKFEKKIDLEALGIYLNHGYYHYPNTVFENLSKLPPATYITVKEGKVSQTKYWDVAEIFFEGQKNIIKDYQTAKIELKQILNDIVEANTKQNIKYGSFLSGGIDSSILAAILQKQSPKKIETFTIGFDDKKQNEAVFAREIATHIGTSHNELYITIDDMCDFLEEIPIIYDEPFGDSSQIPMSIVMKMAKQKVDYVFAGDGSDEILGGYGFLKQLLFLTPYQGIIKPINILIKELGLYSHLIPKYKRVLSLSDEQYKTQMINSEEDTLIKKMLLTKPTEINFPIEKNFAIKDLVRRNLLMLQYTYLVGTLIKVEQPSAFYNMNVVSPFLSRQMVEFTNQLPTDSLVTKSNTKIILKDLLNDYVPRGLTDRPKHGFSIPVLSWLRNDKMRDIIDYYLGKEFTLSQGLFDYDQVAKRRGELFENRLNPNFIYNRTLWHLLIFQIWYKKYMIDFTQ